MKNQILIHGNGKQTRIALLENGELAQLFIEAPENQRTVGDIYVCEVHKVMAGIRAAFITIGTPKDAFLHFSDVGDNLENYIEMLNGPGAIEKALEFNKNMHNKYNRNQKRPTNLSPGLEKQMRAGEVLMPGQKILVQIVKEPIGSKGPRVSTDITIAGRFVVLIPKGDYTAVSKRIRSYKERRRLRSLISPILPEQFGIIVRTVAQGQPDNVLIQDVKDVLSKWESVLSGLKSAKPPTLLYRDLDMTESLIRDLFAKDFNQILIDDSKIYKQTRNYIEKVAPHMLPNIRHYKGREHIFDYAGISHDVDSVFSPRVKMPSGGYLIFEQTEAMYVVDVNSGRYAAKRNQEENSLKTNLEAAREVAKQLRLRDIGGIIVVDFIDLKDDVNRKKIYDELKKEFRKDKAKTNVLPMSDFGLGQITRQRIRPSVVNSVSRVCPMCGGSGSVVSSNTIIADIESWLMKFKNTYSFRSIDLYINPYLKGFFTRGIISERVKWLFRYKIKVNITSDETISMNDFKFSLTGNDADITEAVIQDKPIEMALKESEEELLSLESTSQVDKDNLEVEERKSIQKPKQETHPRQKALENKDVQKVQLPSAMDLAKNYAQKNDIDVNSNLQLLKENGEFVANNQELDKKEANEKLQFNTLESAFDIALSYSKKHNIDVEDNLNKLELRKQEYYQNLNSEESEEVIDEIEFIDGDILNENDETSSELADTKIGSESDTSSNLNTHNNEPNDALLNNDLDENLTNTVNSDSKVANENEEVNSILVKSSIQFTESETDQVIELEILDTRFEILEKNGESNNVKEDDSSLYDGPDQENLSEIKENKAEEPEDAEPQAKEVKVKKVAVRKKTGKSTATKKATSKTTAKTESKKSGRSPKSKKKSDYSSDTKPSNEKPTTSLRVSTTKANRNDKSADNTAETKIES